MRYMDKRNYRKRIETREKQIMDRIAYNQNLREIHENEKSMDRLYEHYCSKAIEAENAGNHEQAVRVANEALRIKKQKDISTNMKNAMEIIRNVQVTNRAMSEISAISKDTLRGFSNKQIAQDLSTVQMEFALANENLKMLMGQSDLLLDEYDEPAQNQMREEDELYLQELLSASQKEKQNKLLRDTQRRLQRIQRNRPVENERSK